MAQTQRVEALRGFQHRREIIGPGSVIDLEMPTALELRTANKVKFVHNETPKAHKTELPDPNRIHALRAQQRAATLAAPPTAAEQAAAATGSGSTGKGATKEPSGK